MHCHGFVFAGTRRAVRHGVARLSQGVSISRHEGRAVEGASQPLRRPGAFALFLFVSLWCFLFMQFAFLHLQAQDDAFLGPAGMPFTDPRFRAYLHYGWTLAWSSRGFTRRRLAPKSPSENDIAYAICVVSPIGCFECVSYHFQHFLNAFTTLLNGFHTILNAF